MGRKRHASDYKMRASITIDSLLHDRILLFGEKHHVPEFSPAISALALLALEGIESGAIDPATMKVGPMIRTALARLRARRRQSPRLAPRSSPSVPA